MFHISVLVCGRTFVSNSHKAREIRLMVLP